MPNAHMELFLGFATLYVGLVTFVATVAPIHVEHAGLLPLPMRYVRYLSVAILLKLIIEMVASFGPQLFYMGAEGALSIRVPPEISLVEASELFLGLFLIALLWVLRTYLFDLEQAARKYRGWT